jgi:hypothetical protein
MRTNLLIIAAFLLGAVGTARCAPVYNPTTGHWYDIVPSDPDGSWLSAEINANALGGHLVTINDATEEAWLRVIFGTDTRYWIGFTDADEEGTWIWSSGEIVTYTNWDAGEPSNHTPPAVGEDFAVLNWNYATGGWNDWDHERPDYYQIDGIAEFDVFIVDVDIKPGSCPNPLNVKSQGVLPVAILGTEYFDVSDVDVGAVRLAGVAPIRFNYADVATPFEGELCDCHELGPDGYLDLTLKFDTQEVLDALGEVEDGDVLELILTGEGVVGIPIEGSDCIRIIKKGKD